MKTLLNNKWDQFQNLMNVVKKLKQFNVMNSDWVATFCGKGRTL